MEEKELKTSVGQRVAIALIAIIMVGSMIASYAAIIISGSSSGSSSDTEGIGNERIAYYEEAYYTKLNEFKNASQEDFETFWQYKGAIAGYNENAANEGGLVRQDLLTGSGRELSDGDTDYLAYYVGWCADETIFDSSLDDETNATAFSSALTGSADMIAGWTTGVIGMRLGGVRVITIPGELAYGDSTEICGGYNKPLKFLVMTVANEDPLRTLKEELSLAYTKLYYAYYGIDYEKQYGA